MNDERGPVPAGARVAGYRLDEQIGRGGMAVVYRAYDLQLDRQVALKVLDPVLAGDGDFQQRFIRESRAAAAVDHPNIIPVFAAGEADGVLFIAMRYVSGPDVRTLIDSTGPLGARRTVDIVTQVAAALDTAHGRGLVHRDVKPANMLLDPAPGGSRSDHVYLSDFGLSKQALASLGLTATGQLVGTLDYVAPEQIENRPVDGRSDLYSLACAAFEMLGGTPPFRRDQHLALLWAQLSEPPPPLTSQRPDLPPAVDQVMAKALAKSPGDRYPRCLDFAAALRAACLAGPGEVAGSGQVAVPGPADEVDTAPGAALFPGVPSGEGHGGPPTDPAHSPWVLQTPLTPPAAASGPATDVSFPAGPPLEPLSGAPPEPPTGPLLEPPTGPLLEPPTGPPFESLTGSPAVPPPPAGPSPVTGSRPAAGGPPAPPRSADPGPGGAPAWWPAWSPWSSWAWAVPRWPSRTGPGRPAGWPAPGWPRPGVSRRPRPPPGWRAFVPGSSR